MPKYRKKPVTIEAWQWNGETNVDSAPDWLKAAHKDFKAGFDWQMGTVHMSLSTLEGRHLASPSDFIIRGVEGEIYACKPEIFEKTYEKVDE